MSTIASVSSTTNSNSAANQIPDTTSFAQFAKDLQAIGTALQSGDLTGVQSVLQDFEQILTGKTQTSTASIQPFGKNSQANTDFQNLISALQSGDATSAQQAFTSLQTDLQAAFMAHNYHHLGASAAALASSNSSTGGASGSLNFTA